MTDSGAETTTPIEEPNIGTSETFSIPKS